jgi:DNA replication protein DnaC
MAAQFRRLAETAASQQQTHLDYLEALLGAEMEEREQNTIKRRLKEAHLPNVKTLDEFQFTAAPNIAASKLKELANGGYIERVEPVLFIGDSGTGKTHLLTALCVAACRQKRRVRFTTATGLIKELVEAQHQDGFGQALKGWSRYDVIAIDEVGYAMAVGAEYFFQVIADRAEKSTVILTTNCPFPNGRKSFPTRDFAKR